MEQRIKRFKITKESNIADIASSLDHIAKSVKSISESHNEILRVNKAVVTYLRNLEKREKEISQIVTDIEQPSKEKQ